ncbi:hypothetical protein ASE99_08540 [Serratia sp. Leaf51]|nr:hypothetical protein ASE99_08540 [Serratia sp. Leaf51]
MIGGTTGAQSGAAISLDAERYNRQLHPDEVARIQQLSGGVIHGFFQLGGISPTARNLMRDLAWRVSSSDKP